MSAPSARSYHHLRLHSHGHHPATGNDPPKKNAGGGGGGPRRGNGRGQSRSGGRRSTSPSDLPASGAGGRGPQQHQHQHRHGGDHLWSSGGDEALRQFSLLRGCLERRGVFDSYSGLRRRRDVLGSLESVLERWSDNIRPVGGAGASAPSPVAAHPEPLRRTEEEAGAEGGASPPAPAPASSRKPRVTVISFGSYRLGVHRPDGDIDALALSPPHCTRAEFFGSLVKMLREDPRVTKLHPVPGAYTPVIKFYMDGVPIDLLFARLAHGDKLCLPPLALLDDEMSGHSGGSGRDEGGACSKGSVGIDANVGVGAVPRPLSPLPRTEFQLEDADLISLDEAGVRSLNGVRVAQMLLAIIPDLPTYRLALRTVKEWALVRGLYSNVLGFLGGVNWAILVAWICVRNEGASAPACVARFMRTFARWRWPKPVSLGPVARSPPVPGIAPLPVWNPRSDPRDAAHLMPILTPVYPAMNSSYNVGQPQMRQIQHELYRGERIVNGIATGRNKWDDLFGCHDFFRQHEHYLQVNVTARNAEDFRSWFGLCEARMRILIAGLENPECGVQCYPFAKFFHLRERGGGTEQDKGRAASSQGQEGGVAEGEGNGENVVEQANGSAQYAASFFVALRFAYGIENVDLRSCTEEYLLKINAWDGRRWGMDLTIEHRTRQHLPSFVFDELEGENERVRVEARARGMAGEVVEEGSVLPPPQAAAAATGAADRSNRAPSPPTNPSPHKRPRRYSPE